MRQRKIICTILRLCTSLLVCLTVHAQTNPNQPDTVLLKDGQMRVVLSQAIKIAETQAGR